MGDAGQQDRPVTRRCPKCRKKMAAFKRGDGWSYVCPDEPQHVQDELAAKQRTGAANKGGVRKGTPSPLKGRKKKKKGEEEGT